jgi:glycosyltransferase involved in cell wall biosynthesis
MIPPRRIGVVTTSFPRWPGDPAGAFVLGLSAALAARGHAVEVIAPEPREAPRWGGKEAWLGGVRVVGAPYARPRRLEALFYGAGVPDNVARNPALGALAPLAAASIAAAVHRRAPLWDAVVSEWLLPSALAVASLGSGRPPHLAIAHSADVHLLARLPFAPRIAARIARGAERVGFVADVLRREFRGVLGEEAAARFDGKLVLAPMGIDPAGLATERSRGELRAQLGLEGFAVLCLGRLVPIKGVDVLIDAVAREAGMSLVVAGDGPERGALERRARERGIDARFVGTVDEQRRAELFAACDALAVPSRVLPDGRHEGMPVVAIEAMCAGVPVAAAASGGVPEVVRDGETGLLVDPGDARALAAALARLRDDPALRAAVIAGGRALAAHRTWDAVASSAEEVFAGAAPAFGRSGARPA